ncbi:MAG TPA: hypothetical protein PLV42_07070 [bacterium]|nr:hypothetical protein [bacterium]
MAALNKIDRILISITRSHRLHETDTDIAYVRDGLRHYDATELRQLWHIAKRNDKMSPGGNGKQPLTDFMRLGDARLKVATVLRLIDEELDRRNGKKLKALVPQITA